MFKKIKIWWSGGFFNSYDPIPPMPRRYGYLPDQPKEPPKISVTPVPPPTPMRHSEPVATMDTIEFARLYNQCVREGRIKRYEGKAKI